MASLIHLPINQVRHNNAEVLLMRLNGINIYDKYTNRIEYTVNNYDFSLTSFTSSSLLSSKDVYGYYCAGLPRIYSDASTYTYDGYERIKIRKTDGTTTNNTETMIKNISKVTLYYPETTYSIRFFGGYSTATSSNYNPLIQTATFYNTSNIVNMSRMFYNCTDLLSVNTGSWDTSKVIDMSYMFYNCINLQSLNFSNWDTSKVTDMSHMFYGCFDIATLNVNNLNTRNVTNMDSMFSNCIGLTSLSLNGLNTSNVTNMSRMFDECSRLVELDLSDFDTSKVTNMSDVFRECNSLKNLNLSNWNTSNVINMDGMFDACNNLVALDLSSFDTSKVTNMSRMFYICRSLKSLDLSNWDLSKATSLGSMFSYCSSLHTIKLNNCSNDTISKIITSGGFPTGDIGVTRTIYCKESEAVGLTPPDNWVFSYVSDEPEIPLYKVGQFKNKEITEVRTMVNESHDNLSHMFFGCSNLISVNTEDWDTSNVTNMSAMFHSCSSLTTLDLSSFDTSKVTYMVEVFNSCNSLQSLNLSNWDTSKVTGMNYMFQYCINLVNLDLSSFDMSKVTMTNNMFYSCRALTNLQAPRNISADINFSSCTNLTHDSLMSIINNLATISGKTLTLGETNLAKLSEEEKAIATNKGWALA